MGTRAVWLALAASFVAALLWLTGMPAAPTSVPRAQPGVPRPESADGAPVVPAVPTPVSAVRDHLDLAYSFQSPAQRLNLHLPRQGDGPFPTVVWIHGGGWESGTRALGAGVPQRALLEAGYAVASVDYRLSREAVFPAQLLDVKAAVRYLRANAAELGLDPGRIGAWGDSAGGHLAALLGTTADVAPYEVAIGGNEGTSSRLQAVVDWYGPSSFTTVDRQLAESRCSRRVGGTDSTVGRLLGAAVSAREDLARAASPVTFVSPDDPPFLIQHGRDDCTVPWQQSAELAQALNVGQAGASLELLDDAGHGGARFEDSANIARVVAFLDTHLR